MIGMHMSFQYPLKLQLVARDIRNDLVRPEKADGPRGVIQVHNRIDNGAGAASRVFHHIGKGVGEFVEKGGDSRPGCNIDVDLAEGIHTGELKS